MKACATVTQTPRRDANPVPKQCGGFRAYTSLRVRVPTTRHRDARARQDATRAFTQGRAHDNDDERARHFALTRARVDQRLNASNNAVTCNNAQERVRSERPLRATGAAERAVTKYTD